MKVAGWMGKMDYAFQQEKEFDGGGCVCFSPVIYKTKGRKSDWPKGDWPPVKVIFELGQAN